MSTNSQVTTWQQDENVIIIIIIIIIIINTLNSRPFHCKQPPASC